ncbi:DUF6284 family protein [Streptomyces sp. WAC 00631]|uniref:DUF6284 family protein n=1 Tax=Streptomyces sp. WAC 00631 TaxID=2203201 RepID=UPI000F7B0E5E|nr:DUF6284 family protein [Streptomyces sp. WAC 00631]MCC5034710.1 DUF6284 family protein [Streptomyces sp. WAC 00631]
MRYIGARQAVVTATPFGLVEREPTGAELDAIERELPLILAEVELLDVQITALDRIPCELGARRIRRARRRVLAARRALTNPPAGEMLPGGAA